MILRITTLLAAFSLWNSACAEVAPEITTVSEGYNIIAKLPCVACPFLYQDNSDGQNGSWKMRSDENALVRNLNVKRHVVGA
jgi:hypothetical protein